MTDRGIRLNIRTSRVLAARRGKTLVATLRLATKRPWAIDAAYFVEVPRPIYLLDMATHPEHQKLGIGRRMVEKAKQAVKAWPGQSIRLDAYDAPAGAGEFYAKCGFREVGRVTYRGTALLYFELLLP
ncbi:MAG: GNAT family N-acetyltransferase [Gemmatimonadaceae bacterium]